MAANGYGNLMVGAGVTMNGTMAVPGEAVIDGAIDGTLTASVVHVTDNGQIDGVTTADHVRVAGKVTQTTVAKNTLVIESSGTASGSIAYANLEIAKGGNIQGQISILK
ncbi:MAG: hypothetical protein RL404_721 [Pseudomonadota bacterium]|jgi:cytoskeletal protein CcmA (bactofilin family)